MTETQEEQQRRIRLAKAQRYHRLHCLVTSFDLVSEAARRHEDWESKRRVYEALIGVIQCFANEYFSDVMGWEDGKEHWIRTVQCEIFIEAYRLFYTHPDVNEWEVLFRSKFEAHVVSHLFGSGIVERKYMSGPKVGLAVMQYVNGIIDDIIRGM